MNLLFKGREFYREFHEQNHEHSEEQCDAEDECDCCKWDELCTGGCKSEMIHTACGYKFEKKEEEEI